MKPTIVCLCGSTRFMEAWQAANLEETLAGRIVLSIGCNTKSDADLQRIGSLTPEKKLELDELHKRKIDLADEILVLNVKTRVCGVCGKPCRLFTELADETECCRSKEYSIENYIGDSTRSEIAYAKEHGKRIRYLEAS